MNNLKQCQESEPVLKKKRILKQYRTPKEHFDDLPVKWVSIIYNIGLDGGSDITIQAELNIHRRIFDKFLETEPQFFQAVTIARVNSQNWWENLGKNACSKAHQSFNAAIWIFNMKNRCGWRDKSETEVAFDLSNRLKEIMDKLPD